MCYLPLAISCFAAIADVIGTDVAIINFENCVVCLNTYLLPTLKRWREFEVLLSRYT